MVGESQLYNHYRSTSSLIHNKILTLTEIENLIPFEREIYINMHNELVEAKTNK